MRVAIFSDIHGNLEALQAVLASVAQANCAKTFCLGDTVGYGPNPKECIRIVREAGIPCVQGNHDEACASDAYPHFMNLIARKAVQWTQAQLSTEEKTWLRHLPLLLVDEDLTLAHANVEEPDNWEYITNSWFAARSLTQQKTRFGFIGHTHEPMAWIRTSRVKCDKFDRLHIEPDAGYIINVGSVGQPRDGDPRACYVIYDSDAGYFELKRVPYPIAETQVKIQAAGLPMQLAMRLERGL